MRILTGIVSATGVVLFAACGGGGDVTAPPPGDTPELSCVNPTTAGAAATCSVTLSASAGVKAVVTSHQTCEAHGDSFAFTAPEASTLTTDGCFETIGKEVDLAGPYQSGTQITMAITPGMIRPNPTAGDVPGMAAVRVDGKYPQWTLNVEDASGAFPGITDDYDDLVVTVTVVPTTGG